MKSLFTICLLSFAGYSLALNDALKIKIAGNNYTDETVIRFVQGATPQFDANYDAWKLFSPNPAVPGIYTRCQAGELSINAFGSMNADTAVDLYLIIPAAGPYSINATEIGAFSQGCCIMLEDLQTGGFYDLRSAGSYAFNLAVATVSSPAAFRVHFRIPVALTVTDPTCFGYSDGSLLIQNNGLSSWACTLSDSAGNSLTSGTVSQSMLIQNLNAGNYQLLASDYTGCSRAQMLTITQPPQVVAGFSVSDSVLTLGAATVQFTNSSSNAVSWQWDFGDGSATSFVSDPVHTYTAAGSYTVSLTATSGNCSASAGRIVTVINPTGYDQISAPGTVTVYTQHEKLMILNPSSEPASYAIYTICGREVCGLATTNGVVTEVSLEYLPSGIYLVNVIQGNNLVSSRIYK
ncbi:MAG: PKD domain-containing protein [Bacteroidota bacterium]